MYNISKFNCFFYTPNIGVNVKKIIKHFFLGSSIEIFFNVVFITKQILFFTHCLTLWKKIINFVWWGELCYPIFSVPIAYPLKMYDILYLFLSPTSRDMKSEQNHRLYARAYTYTYTHVYTRTYLHICIYIYIVHYDIMLYFV